MDGYLTSSVLTLDARTRLVKGMKLTPIQIDRMVRKIFDQLKEQKIVEFKTAEDKVHKRAVAIIEADYAKELELDRAVNKMLDELERKNPGEFERYKMYPMLKKRMAKEKGIIL
jgi:hypothetical protein